MQEILLPKMGQTVEEAEIVEWFKQEGDPVAEGEPIFSIQTDKAEVECESTASGVLRKIIVPPGVEVPVLTVVALVGTADEALPDLAQYGAEGGGAAAAPEPEPAQAAPAAQTQPVPAPPAETPAAGGGAASPRARRAAAERGVDAASLQGPGVGGRVMEGDVLAQAGAAAGAKASPTAKKVAAQKGVDLAGVAGTGVGGKVMKDDVLRAAETGPAPAAKDAAPAPAPAGEDQTVPLTPMRRIIAERMSASKYAAPHYYMTVEMDMAGCKRLRGELPFKASYNDLVLYAVARALRDVPAVNAQWAGDAVIQKADVNLGVAVALPTGLIVPVVRQAQNLSLEGLCQAVKGLVEKAKTGKLLPDDYQGNTFTVSNLGAFGVDHFTAIINQPDSAILAVGAMKDTVVARDGGIHVRPMMKVTMSSDHRVVDGAMAAQFLGRLKEILEEANF